MEQHKINLCTVCYVMSDGGITSGHDSIGLVGKTGSRIRDLGG